MQLRRFPSNVTPPARGSSRREAAKALVGARCGQPKRQLLGRRARGQSAAGQDPCVCACSVVVAQRVQATLTGAGAWRHRQSQASQRHNPELRRGHHQLEGSWEHQGSTCSVRLSFCFFGLLFSIGFLPALRVGATRACAEPRSKITAILGTSNVLYPVCR